MKLSILQIVIYWVLFYIHCFIYQLLKKIPYTTLSFEETQFTNSLSIHNRLELVQVYPGME